MLKGKRAHGEAFGFMAVGMCPTQLERDFLGDQSNFLILKHKLKMM